MHLLVTYQIGTTYKTLRFDKSKSITRNQGLMTSFVRRWLVKHMHNKLHSNLCETVVFQVQLPVRAACRPTVHTPSTTATATLQHPTVSVSTTTRRHPISRRVWPVLSATGVWRQTSVSSVSLSVSAMLTRVSVSLGSPMSTWRRTRRVSNVESTTRAWSRPTAVTPSSTVRAVRVVCVRVWSATTRTLAGRSASRERSETSVRRPPTVRQL